ncbi:MAG: hypothetical protein U0L19_10805 [Bacteroidales bacterium]|nr:hypothetical protein [Bacteroidales bacterium]
MHNQNDKLTGIPADAEKKKFTGIWIPAEVWDDDKLLPLARVLYGEIASYGKSGCWVKTEELRQPLGVSSGTFQKLCKQLKDGGYITEQRRFGRIVRTTTLGFQSSKQKLHQSKNCGDEHHKICGDEQHNENAVQLEYTKEYTKEHTKGASAPADAIKTEKAEEYGNHEVNDFLKRWASSTGNDCSKLKRERNATYNLIRSNTQEGLDAIIQALDDIRASGDPYAPQIAKPSDLVGQYSKLPKLRAWVARQAEKIPEPSGPVLSGFPSWLWDEHQKSDEEIEAIKKVADEWRKKLPFMKNKGEGK